MKGRGRGQRIDAGRVGSSGRHGDRFANGDGQGAGFRWSFRGGRGGRSFRGGRLDGAPLSSESPVHHDAGWGNNPETEASTRGNDLMDEDDEDWGNTEITELQDPTVSEEAEEWTSSLETTNVFVASQQQQQLLASEDPSTPPASDLTAIDATKLVNDSLSYSSKLSESSNKSASFAAAAAIASSNVAPTSSMANGASPASVMMPQSSMQQKQESQQSVLNSAAMDLVTLMQQASSQPSMSVLGASTLSKVASSQQNVPSGSSQMMIPGMNSGVGEVSKPAPLPMQANYASNINQHYPPAQAAPMYPPGEFSS